MGSPPWSCWLRRSTSDFAAWRRLTLRLWVRTASSNPAGRPGIPAVVSWRPAPRFVVFLLDTDILSALRRRDRNPEAIRWVEAQRTSDLYLSVVTVGEIERGIVQQRKHDPSFAKELSLWLDRVLAWYSDRILLVDVATARRMGTVVCDLGARRGRPAYRRHHVRARSDRRNPQRPRLRANRSPYSKSSRVRLPSLPSELISSDLSDKDSSAILRIKSPNPCYFMAADVLGVLTKYLCRQP